MGYWRINGQDIEVQRKRIRNLYLHIKKPNGAVLVSAPVKMPEDEIRTFLLKKWNWVLQKQEAVRREKFAMVDFQSLENGLERKEEYRRQLEKQVPLLFKKWEPVVGVHAREWRLRDMKTRWGSCNVQEKRIWLNIQLAGKPPECLEYVVVHELCHLLEASHNKVFWDYMSAFLPDWRERKKRLNGQQ